jgi:DNA-binding NtrC family response regulator
MEGEQILLIEPDPPLSALVVEVLNSRGYRVVAAGTAAAGIDAVRSPSVDLVITALDLPDVPGRELLARIREASPETPVIGSSSSPRLQEAVEVIRAGASDYLAKPFQTDVLLDSIRKVLQETVDTRRRARERRGMTSSYLAGIVARSKIMQRLFDGLADIAKSPAPVLITGETGTGKDLLALAVHKASGGDPFVPVNCGAIPDHLMESELFGHGKGAFTGADREKAGLVEAADGGTLFLDEIAELPLALQSKLLRFLESGEFRRVGEVETRHVQVRLVAATHQDLQQAVQEGRFRQDVFYRINVLHLALPPLRDRSTDIPLLAERFSAEIARRDGREELQFSPDALAALVAHPWPGNIREFRNVIERIAARADRVEIGVGDLPPEISSSRTENGFIDTAAERALSLADVTREYTLEVLRRSGNNKSRAARLLGVPRRTLYRRLESWGID